MFLLSIALLRLTQICLRVNTAYGRCLFGTTLTEKTGAILV